MDQGPPGPPSVSDGTFLDQGPPSPLSVMERAFDNKLSAPGGKIVSARRNLTKKTVRTQRNLTIKTVRARRNLTIKLSGPGMI